jgi:hypothetical protein
MGKEMVQDNLVCGKCGEPIQFVEGVTMGSWESTYEIYECECGAKWRMYLLKDDDANIDVFATINRVCRRTMFD